MRGKVADVLPLLDGFRITPAHAGKRHLLVYMLVFARDHPRPCGEKSYERHFFCKNAGSPPPMRGKDGNDLTDTKIVGITPAHAGKSGLSYAI